MASERSILSAFHDNILERGTLFAVLFYFLITALALSIAGALYQGLAEGDLLAFTYALLFSGLSLYFFKRQHLYPLLVTAVFPIYAITLVLSFQSLPGLVSIAGPVGTYTVVAAAALVLGAVPAYLFRDISPGILYYLTIAVYGSSVIAILSGMVASLSVLLRTLRTVSQTPQILFGGPESLVAVAATLEASLLFGIGFTLFNAPFLAYARRRDDFDVKLLPLYLGPLILYVLIRASASTVLYGGT